MIDIHNHLLPSIDDGAPNVETAIKLAKIAIEDGITHMVCTPHIHPGRYDNTFETITEAKNKLKIALQKEGLALQLAAAAEVRFGLELMSSITNSTIPFLGEWLGKKVILLEFPHGEIPFAAERLTSWLSQNNVIPLIAHPERNKGLLTSPSKLKPFIQQGCLLQVTSGSLVGKFGSIVQKLAIDLLQQGLITILASDAHNEQHRPPILTDGFKVATEIIGEDKAYQLVHDNPWEIVQSHF